MIGDSRRVPLQSVISFVAALISQSNVFDCMQPGMQQQSVFAANDTMEKTCCVFTTVKGALRDPQPHPPTYSKKVEIFIPSEALDHIMCA